MSSIGQHGSQGSFSFVQSVLYGCVVTNHFQMLPLMSSPLGPGVFIGNSRPVDRWEQCDSWGLSGFPKKVTSRWEVKQNCAIPALVLCCLPLKTTGDQVQEFGIGTGTWICFCRGEDNSCSCSTPAPAPCTHVIAVIKATPATASVEHLCAARYHARHLSA